MSSKLAEAAERIKTALVNQTTELDLFGLGLTELPSTLSELRQLKTLDISGNRLATLPESIGALTQLQNLDVSGNGLTGLPDWMCNFPDLRVLRLSYNELGELPESIGCWTKLQWLTLLDSKLVKLPDSIGRLRGLQVLRASGNLLVSVPESLGNLTRLQELDLSYNALNSLPESLQRLTSLAALYLHGNHSLELPAEVLGPQSGDVSYSHQAVKPADILDYYMRLRGGRQPLNEAKLILVGRGAVGKTSIVNRLVHDIFKDEKKTEGIKITEWALQLNEQENVRLNVWDFGGQEIMHATHQFFLTQRSVYLLVINGREGGEDADAEYWLKLIESFGGESPVIIVLNKIKEHPFDLNRRALQQKYPMICEFVKTDCQEGVGIQQLLKAIERETDLLEHLRDAFPANWFTIKNKLAGMKRNFLSFDEYRKECHQLGEKDRASQEALASYLHSLGIALNYKDDPRLQDTHVLNPHWVTNGIYKILNSATLEKQQGEIRLEDLSAILDPEEYPASMRRFLFDLMKKFELCFSFPEDDTHYLIPELLDKQEPSEASDFNEHECLNFQYHYPVLPEGLLPRFIVRTHVLSERLPKWRTGVITHFEGSVALIKADVQDKKIFISVSGPPLNRRRLLAIIRSDFERIHRDIRNLQPAEMVPLPDYPTEVMGYGELLVMEANDVATIPKVVGNTVIELNVAELLNGVDLEGTRKRDRIREQRGQAVRLFISYSHKDESLRSELESHLKILQRQELIETWHDRKIDPGSDWKRRIDDHLERADIVLLLISADFVASDYCYDQEMKSALAREKAGKARVIPVIVRDVNWSKSPFAKLQALPKDGLAVTKWPDRDSAWRNISEGIERLVDQIRQRPDRLVGN